MGMKTSVVTAHRLQQAKAVTIWTGGADRLLDQRRCYFGSADSRAGARHSSQALPQESLKQFIGLTGLSRDAAT